MYLCRICTALLSFSFSPIDSEGMVVDASAGSGSSVIGSPIVHLESVTFSARCEMSLSLCLNRGCTFNMEEIGVSSLENPEL